MITPNELKDAAERQYPKLVNEGERRSHSRCEKLHPFYPYRRHFTKAICSIHTVRMYASILKFEGK